MDAAPDRPDPGPPPPACTLGPADGPDRLRRWRRLHERAAAGVRLRGGLLEVRYRPGPGVQGELADLAAAERECCPFVGWQVTVVDGRPVLRVTAPPGEPGAVAPIAALFAALGPPASPPG
jgi:MerR family copper efflux transcriptional regulator